MESNYQSNQRGNSSLNRSQQNIAGHLIGAGIGQQDQQLNGSNGDLSDKSSSNYYEERKTSSFEKPQERITVGQVIEAGQVQMAESRKDPQIQVSESSSYSTDQEINEAIKMQQRAQRKHDKQNQIIDGNRVDLAQKVAPNAVQTKQPLNVGTVEQTFTLSQVKDDKVVLISQSSMLVEMPSMILPGEAHPGQIYKFKIERCEQAEEQRKLDIISLYPIKISQGLY